MEEDSLALVIRLISRSGGVDPSTITRETTLESILFDSLDMVELVMYVEDELHIAFPSDVNRADLRTVGDLADLIDKLR